VSTNKFQAAHVGPAQLELLRHALVEVAGSAEVPGDLVAELLPELTFGPLS